MARVKVKKQSTFIDMTAMSGALAYFLYAYVHFHPEGADTGFDLGFRDGDQDTRNRYSPDFGG